MKLVVTTAHGLEEELCGQARDIATQLGASYVSRKQSNLKKLALQWKAEGVVVVAKQRISCHWHGGEFFFHPSMAQLRLKEMMAGKQDAMVRYLGIEQGDTILDCTLGLGSDALIAAFAAGEKGGVTGLESSPLIALLVEHGLGGLQKNQGPLGESSQRIQVCRMDYRDFLYQADTNSYDIVYFDPMFRQGIKKSPSMDVMRPFANSSPLAPEFITEAFRVCRKRVVLKEKKNSLEFVRLGFPRVVGGKHAPVAYGIWDKRSADWVG